MSTTIDYRFRCRRRTAANWTAANEVLLDSEIGLESDTGLGKIGDGVTAWNALLYRIVGNVDLTGIADGKCLAWDATHGKWIIADRGVAYTAGTGINIDTTTPGAPVINSTVGAVQLKGRVALYSNLPATGNTAGDAYVVDLDGLVYIYDSGWPANGRGLPIGPDFGIAVPALFAHGEVGVWFDASDINTLFQDAGATAPVTAVGNPVQRVNDKSGNAIIATGACTYQQDSAGRACLAFNGTSNYLTFGSLGAGEQREICAIVGITTPVPVLLESSSNSNTNTGSWLITANEVPTSAQFGVTQRTVSSYNKAVYDIYSTGVSCMQVRMDRTLAPYQYQRFLYRDGTERQVTSTPFATALTTETFYAGPHFINSRAGSSLFGTASIYELVVVNRVLTPTERAALARMMMRKWQM